MSESTGLPPGWAVIPLRDLGEWSGGGTPSKNVSSFWSGGAIPWVSPKDMKVPVISESLDHITDDAVRASAVKLIPPGSVLIVTRSGILAHTLPVARTAVAVTVNQDIKALTPTPPFDPDFIAWGARAFGWSILNTCSKDGTTVANVDTTLLQDFRLPVAPGAEQRRIVAAIESYFTRLDDAVATLARVQRNLKRYRASVLKAAVEGRLVPTEAELARAEGRSYEPASVLLTRILAERRRRWEEAELAKMTAKGKAPKDDKWKEKYVEPVAADASELPDVPEGWCWSSVDQLIENHDRDRVPIKRAERAKRRGRYPYYGASGVIDTIDEFLFDGSFLLVGEDGANLLARSTPIAFQAHGQFWVNNHAHVLRTYLDLPLAYVEAFFNATDLARYVTGTAQPKLPQAAMNRIPVPLCPAAEQFRIVEAVERQLSIADDVTVALDANSSRCRSLRQSILKWAFEGRLVDQDPTDEPASVLLERIRAERASAANTPPRRTRRANARASRS